MARSGRRTICAQKLVSLFVTQIPNSIAVAMAVCIRGERRSADVRLWDVDGDCRLMMNGGDWPSTMGVFVKILMTSVKPPIARSYAEAAQALIWCWVAAVRTVSSSG